MEKVRVKHHYPLSSKTQKDQIEAFLWTEKDHLISYTHSYQKYVCTYGWVLSVKKNFWYKYYLGENVSHSLSNLKRITPLPKYWKNFFFKLTKIGQTEHNLHISSQCASATSKAFVKNGIIESWVCFWWHDVAWEMTSSEESVIRNQVFKAFKVLKT